jgi:carbon storage regulator
MLVLSRQRDEAVLIGDDIRVIVVDIRGDKVRLGIHAPSKYAVYRKELYDKIIKDIHAGQPKPGSRGGRDGMLVLARQRDETIYVIDQDDWEHPVAEITIVDIRGDKVRIGFTAEKVVTIHRQEVYDAIQRENRSAAKTTTTQD